MNNDPIQSMVDRYKKHVKENGLTDEIYKWELVQKFKGHPDVNAENFIEEIKSLDISNLAYNLTKAVAVDLAENKAEEYRDAFVELFNEKTAFDIRVISFSKTIKRLYNSLGKTHPPHHNEREIATFLTYHNPVKYTFYMPKYYEAYCKLLGIKSKTVGVKYVHYLELIDELIENYIINDDELLQTIDAELIKGKFYPDKNRKILAQDILYQTERLENKKMKKSIVVNITWNSNNWKGVSEDISGHAFVKQGGIPHESWNFDFENQRNTDGYVYGFSQFTKPPKIEGSENLVIFYSQKKIVGFYGGAEILQESVKLTESQSYNIVGKRELAVSIINKIDDVKDKGFLENKKRIGRIGFNHIQNSETVVRIIEEAIRLNPGQSETLANLLNWYTEENYTEKKMNETKNMNPQPLNQILYGPPGTGKTYHSINKALEIILPDFDTNQDREIVKSKFNEFVSQGQIVFTTFHQSMTYEDFVEGIKPTMNEEDSNSLNYKIEDGIFKRLSYLAKYEWIKIDKINQNRYSREELFEIAYDELITDVEEKLDNNLVFDIVTRTGLKVYIYDVSEQHNLHIKHKDSVSELPHIVSKQRVRKLFLHFKSVDEIKNINQDIRAVIGGANTTTYWGVLSNLFERATKIEKIRFKVEENPVSTTNYESVKSIVSSTSITGSVHRINIKNFVLVIDEINRGNIAQIFGELITLIEDDKRLGNAEALEITLPYSKEKFGVPANLYIIGTMNTADRSVEALDTALRRRFSFEERQPDAEIIRKKRKLAETNGVLEDIDLPDLLETINRRIEVLLDKDHQIGHSYFMNVSDLKGLKREFQNKIIPLLQEYFFGDFGKIGLTLGEGFVKVKTNENETHFFASFSEYDNEDQYRERPVYTIENPVKMNDEVFKSAIKKLMNFEV